MCGILTNQARIESSKFWLRSHIAIYVTRNTTSHRYLELVKDEVSLVDVERKQSDALFLLSIKQRSLVLKPVSNIGKKFYSW